MPTPIVAGNWKMNTTVAEAVRLASDIRKGLGESVGIEVVLCPPFISLVSVGQVIQGTPLQLGAQNMYFQEKGAFTGEVSPLMLSGLCHFVILGHSERRHILGEDDGLINRKVKAAFSAGLRPILCVGETLPERQAGQADAIVQRQLEKALEGINSIAGLVVAYEPVWAIGTGVAATPETAAEMMGGVLLAELARLYGEHVALEVPLLYGGSVNPQNVTGFVRVAAIHGALVGGASLNASQFVQIVQETARAKGRR